MHSFESTLRAVCRDVQPKKIVEWGPGKSTAVMREECKDAIIISVEHDPRYARLARETGQADHVFEFAAAQPKSKYAVWPLECFDDYQRIDLAFGAVQFVGNPQQQAHRHAGHQHAGTAGRDQQQRNAGQRQGYRDTADIEEDMDHEIHRNL